MKNKIDSKLINIAIIAVIIYLLSQSTNLWWGILSKILKIVLPLFAGFVIAYALHPVLEILKKHKIPKSIGVGIIIVGIIAIIITILVLLVPLLSTQFVSLLDSLLVFVKNFTENFNLDLGSIQDTLMQSLNEIITNVGKYVSDGAVKTINASINAVTNIVVAIASSVYFLIDMDKIRDGIKSYLRKKSKLWYEYISKLDYEIKNYLKGFMRIVCISFFEYTIAYYIIGHPNALLLGFLAGLSNFIPYFGGTIIQVIAAVTAFVVSPSLFVKVLILAVILSVIDTYIINPLVYGKSNAVHPIVVIASVFAGGILFGFVGIIIALPLSIIVLATYKFYKDRIKDA